MSDPPAGDVSHWLYHQPTGILTAPDGSVAGAGYAGYGDGVNNPADEAIPDVGPIPHGRYSIGPAFTHPVCGPVAMRLEPLPGTDTHGRSGFLMHGDSSAMNHTASHGCIIMARDIRLRVAASAVRVLVVVG